MLLTSLFVATALPSGEHGSLQPAPGEELPPDIAGMIDEADLPFHPLEVRHALELRQRGGHLINSGATMTWIESKKVGVCACAPPRGHHTPRARRSPAQPLGRL